MNQERLSYAIAAFNEAPGDPYGHIGKLAHVLAADDQWKREHPPELTDNQLATLIVIIADNDRKSHEEQAQAVFSYCRQIVIDAHGPYAGYGRTAFNAGGPGHPDTDYNSALGGNSHAPPHGGKLYGDKLLPGAVEVQSKPIDGTERVEVGYHATEGKPYFHTGEVMPQHDDDDPEPERPAKFFIQARDKYGTWVRVEETWTATGLEALAKWLRWDERRHATAFVTEKILNAAIQAFLAETNQQPVKTSAVRAAVFAAIAEMQK